MFDFLTLSLAFWLSAFPLPDERPKVDSLDEAPYREDLSSRWNAAEPFSLHFFIQSFIRSFVLSFVLSSPTLVDCLFSDAVGLPSAIEQGRFVGRWSMVVGRLVVGCWLLPKRDQKNRWDRSVGSDIGLTLPVQSQFSDSDEKGQASCLIDSCIAVRLDERDRPLSLSSCSCSSSFFIVIIFYCWPMAVRWSTFK